MANSRRIARLRGAIRVGNVDRSPCDHPRSARIVPTADARSTAIFARMEDDTIQTCIAVRNER